MVEELLSEGGMGEVYLGRQLSVDRLVAIKLMRDEIAQEPQLMARFFRESRALSALHHPNIVTLFDFGQDEATGSLYMVMELLRGSSMADVPMKSFSAFLWAFWALSRARRSLFCCSQRRKAALERGPSRFIIWSTPSQGL